MPVLRELITRFSFETDTKSVRKYDSTIAGMRRSALKLGGILGLSFGAKQFFDLTVNAEQARSNIERLAGTNLGKLNAGFDEIESRLVSLNSASIDILTDKQQNVLASGFIEQFGNSAESIETLLFLMEKATIQAGVSGRSIKEVFGGLFEGLKTGDLSALTQFGDINLKKLKLEQAKLDSQDPSEFGNLARLRLSQTAFSTLLGSIENQLEEQFRNASPTLLGLRTGKTKASDAADRAGELLVEGLVTGINTLTEILTPIAGVVKSETPEKAVGALFNKALNNLENSKKKNGDSRPNQTKVELNSNVTINGATDTKKTQEMIDQSNRKMVDDAARQLGQGEDR